MKRSVLFSILIIFLISMPFMIADEVDDKLNASYTCLTNKVNGKCNTLSPEEKIFSLLAIEKCKNEVIADSTSNAQCWPKSGCNLKTTSQAVLALDNVNVNVTNATNWLLSQNAVPSDIDWYLEIESTEATTCTITYDSASYSVNIGTDKKINTGAGSCLSLSESPYADYWLKIAPTCYNKKFDISCSKSFLTTLLYKKTDSPIIYVSDKTSSASAGGATEEKVDFSCFKQGSTCNYEGSLWVAFVLNYLGKDISSYKPYLVTMAGDNSQYLPESFLYLMDSSDTNSRTILLSKQKSSKWWSESGDMYYDTALALLPFQNENPTEKTNSKNWLLDVQDSQGCWQGNIRNTAFILYSIWPEYFARSAEGGSTDGGSTDGESDGGSTDGGTGSIDGTDSSTCEDIDGYCTSQTSCSNINGSELSAYSFSCSGTEICCDAPSAQTCDDAEGYCIFETSCLDIQGSELSTYSFSCDGTKICCDTSPSSQTCSDIGGEICNSDETCSILNIETLDTYDCCTGSCQESVTVSESECLSYGGTCRDSCLSDEEENSDECDYIGEVCCVDKAVTISGGDEGSKSYWWIWILLILIVLVVIAIIFRDKLRPVWLRIKSKFSKKPKTPPGFPLSRTPMRRPLHRKPLPSRGFVPKPKSEIDDVLKKLKEIGK